MKRTILLLSIFLCSSVTIAQQKITINDYGAWYVSQNELTKIPTNEYLSLARFWHGYIIFSGSEKSGYVIYNINTQSLSNWIDSADGIFLETNWKYLFCYTNNKKYSMNKKTLRIEKTTARVEKKGYDWKWEVLPSSVLLDRTIRYVSKNGFLDVVFGPKIDISGKYVFEVDTDQKQSYVLLVNDIEDTK